MDEVHLVVPAAVDDPRRPSGGNTYDRRLARALTALGWAVHEHRVPGDVAGRDPDALASLAATLDAVDDEADVVVDGLLASAADDVVVPAATRLRLGVLIHLALGERHTNGSLDPVAQRERRVLLAAEGVLVTSGWSRERLLHLYDLPSDRVRVAAPGAEPAELAPGTADGTSWLVVGAVSPVKGHDVLLDALARLTDLPWTCRVGGSLDVAPAYAEGLRRRASDGLRSRVRFEGPLQPSALAAEYARSDLVLLPSRVESYGMAATEALARGIPVVASDVGGVREALGTGGDGVPGLLVPPEDPEALAGSLRRWLADESLRTTLRRRAGRRRTELPGWDTTAEVVAAALAHEPGAAALRLPVRRP